MATFTRLSHDGYGMLERNRVDPVNMESQCVLGSDFADGAEVGMIVAVDKATNTLKKEGNVYGLLANSERTYNQYHAGLKNFSLTEGDMGTVLFLENGHTFTTNTVGFDTDADYSGGESAFLTAMAPQTLASAPMYGFADHTEGVIRVVPQSKKGKAPLQVVKLTTMPDGQAAIKFIVINEAGFGEEVAD